MLGALLVNNEVLERLSDFLLAEHFYDPVHKRVFERIAERVERGQIASPITLKPYFEADPGMSELGGAAYLLRLADAAIAVFNVQDYARVIYEMALRRRLMELGEDISDRAGDFDLSLIHI